jgi:hypothetical protein
VYFSTSLHFWFFLLNYHHAKLRYTAYELNTTLIRLLGQ